MVRRLRNLELIRLVVDDVELEPTEANFVAAIIAAADVSSYADWLLIVDYLVFVTEDRAQPFWDKNVQRQLLRVLIRDPASASALLDAESFHISADSDFRNARVQLTRHKQRFEAQASKVSGTGDVNDALIRLATRRDELDLHVAELELTVEKEDDLLEASIREVELAELERQMAVDELEARRLALIDATLPSHDDVIRYLAARVALEVVCPICGQEGGDIPGHIAGDTCFLCGLTVQRSDDAMAFDVERLETRVQEADVAVEANALRLRERQDSTRKLHAVLAAERGRRAEIDGRIKALRSQLPTGTTDLASTASMIADLEQDLESLRSQAESSRATLQALIETSNEAVVSKQDDIKRVFDEVATMFLVEQCHLVPHLRPIRIGQEGERFEIQSFDLDLGSASDIGESRRDASDEVSESQRVFIDVAFRIALVQTCAGAGAGTMVIDAPEGSLDAVFSANAAELLSAFSVPGSQNRMIVASNLIEGSLLPELARRADIRSSDDPRVVNLLEIAAPTAAVVARGDEYRAVLSHALNGTPDEP